MVRLIQILFSYLYPFLEGPPGTGKTTTITAAAQFWDSHNLSVWIVAHSNVAVKNIAEKLFDHEVDFKILVSKDFHEEWSVGGMVIFVLIPTIFRHEHLYQSIEEKLIRSDALPKNKVGMERLILSSKVILCTLSMMLHPPLHDNGIFDLVPPRCLVIDEASQVNAFEFMVCYGHLTLDANLIPIFSPFLTHSANISTKSASLAIPCSVTCSFSLFSDYSCPFIVPPFGQNDIPQIQTIFDFKHLNYKEDTYFLNTQCASQCYLGLASNSTHGTDRMPNPIARFISQNVYEGRLRSEHKIDSPECLAFIDVPRTGEKNAGTSTKVCL
jgi:regulator of nonsense transcripts 1